MDFKKAEHTIVLSDIHLAEPELQGVGKHPLWKLFKAEKFFIDHSFENFLGHMRSIIRSPIELVLNGDIFDFDSVMVLPKDPAYKISYLEKIRGLNSEEEKSKFKMQVILESHPVWVRAIRDFILAGNTLIFIIGNHDLELHWPSVQEIILRILNVPAELSEKIRFCEWFYISNQDTLIEHGNQYDAFSLCLNPTHPLIRKGARVLVRIPFGNLAARYMINGIGLMNPHSGSFIQDNFYAYLKFYIKYLMKVQPFLIWTWAWSAFATLFVSVTEGLLPAVKDPLTVDQRLSDIAYKSNATVTMVTLLKEIHVHPAIFDPFKIFQELWLDRALFLGVIIFISYEIVKFVSSFVPVSIIWWIVPFSLLLPVFFFYARSITSDYEATQKAAYDYAPLSARITLTKRIVQGHTHIAKHLNVNGVEIINTGTWSPAFFDVECTKPFSKKCFAWIRPDPITSFRKGGLYEWNDKEGMTQLAKEVV